MILDSRGYPTVECDVQLDDGSIGRAAVPSGASTGSREALELRDGGEAWSGKGVSRAIAHITDDIRPLLEGQDPFDQAAIDSRMCQADGTDNKANFGANAILAASLAVAKSAAASSGIPLHQYIASIAGTTHQQSLPLPMINIENGGAHAGFATDIQEYMIVCRGAKDFEQSIQMGVGVFHALADVLKERGYPTTVGDEGGYAPRVQGGNREPLELISLAVARAGYELGRDVGLALDVAASELYRDGAYDLRCENKRLDSGEMIAWLSELASEFPILSIEDGLAEDDWDGWTQLTTALGDRVQLVGDDLLVTNTVFLERAIEQRAANAILVKLNQIGTLSETIRVVTRARQAGWRTIISHRSGETEDTTIAHLAVGLDAGQIKTGSLSRSERLAKYNELLRIHEAMPDLKLARPITHDTNANT